jgi:hypothetical protein
VKSFAMAISKIFGNERLIFSKDISFSAKIFHFERSAKIFHFERSAKIFRNERSLLQSDVGMQISFILKDL